MDKILGKESNVISRVFPLKEKKFINPFLVSLGFPDNILAGFLNS